MTGITRSTASKVIASCFNITATYVGRLYDSCSIGDSDDRQWEIVCDASLIAQSGFAMTP